MPTVVRILLDELWSAFMSGAVPEHLLQNLAHLAKSLRAMHYRRFIHLMASCLGQRDEEVDFCLGRDIIHFTRSSFNPTA